MNQVALVVIFLLLAALGHGFFWVGIVNRVHSWAGPRPVVDGLTLLCVILFVALPIGVGWNLVTAAGSTFNLAEISRASVYADICVAIGIAMLVAKPLVERRRYDRSIVTESRSELADVSSHVGTGLYCTPRARLLGMIPLNESLQLAVERRTLRIPRLPAALDGMTVCHLSDLHLTGGIGREYYRYLVDRVNDASPDVICVTGDIIENDDCHSWLDSVVGRLQAPLGVHFILGNHDLFVDHRRTISALVESGWLPASGRWFDLQWRGANVRIAGNELPWVQPRGDLLDPPARTADEFRLVLSHSPDQFGWTATADADLTLAGHTHGGQVQLPWLGVIASPSLYGARFACGVFRRGDTVMHVSRGVSGKNPLRWRCPPEAALLQLTGPSRD